MSPFLLFQTLLNELGLLLVWNNGYKIFCVSNKDVNGFLNNKRAETPKRKCCMISRFSNNFLKVATKQER